MSFWLWASSFCKAVWFVSDIASFLNPKEKFSQRFWAKSGRNPALLSQRLGHVEIADLTNQGSDVLFKQAVQRLTKSHVVKGKRADIGFSVVRNIDVDSRSLFIEPDMCQDADLPPPPDFIIGKSFHPDRRPSPNRAVGHAGIVSERHELSKVQPAAICQSLFSSGRFVWVVPIMAEPVVQPNLLYKNSRYVGF
jgi:hypothetical protein